MNEKALILYNQIVNNIPLYFKKSLSVIGVFIFTALSAYIVHASAVAYNTGFYSEIGVPYFSESIDLWQFYVEHIDLLLIIIVSLIFSIGLSILGGIGCINPKKEKIYQYVLYNFFLAIVVFTFFLASSRNALLSYGGAVVAFVVIMSIVQHWSDRNKKDNINEPKEIKDKLIPYSIFLFVTPVILFYPFVGMFSFNVYMADNSGRGDGKILLEAIKNDKYINFGKTAIIKSSEQYVYALNCSELSCSTIRKTENNELLFETMDRKDLIFKSK